MGLNPVDAVLSIIPSLTEKERQQVIDALKQFTVCDKQGHKYKKVKEGKPTWFTSASVMMVCERCGHKMELR